MQNISTLTQAYIDDVYNRIQAGNLTSEETALLVAGLQNLQQNTDLTSVILGIAQSSNNNITENINNLISRLETLETQMSASLQSHLPPAVPLNGTHNIQYFYLRGAYPAFADCDGLNYCVNYTDEIQDRMYVLSTQRNTTNIIDMEFGFYDHVGTYNLLKSGQFENFFGGTDFHQAGAFVLPLVSSNSDSSLKICIVFYNADSIWILTENALSPGSLIKLTANEPRIWLCYDRLTKMLVFMPNATSAVRLYADGSSELITDYTTNDSNQFQANFWGNFDFLQLRGTETPFWQCGPYSNLNPENMGTRTYTGDLQKYYHNYTPFGQPPFAHYSYSFRDCKSLFQVPFTTRKMDNSIEFRKTVFNPDISIAGVFPLLADSYTTNHFQYILNWKGNQNWLLNENGDTLFSIYTNIEYTPKLIGNYRIIYQEPICFDNVHKRIICRTVDAGAFDMSSSSKYISHYLNCYQI